MKQEFITKNEEETYKVAQKVAASLKPRDVICLYGELGAGKTTFTKALAEVLGIQERIISPTYVIVRTHSINNNPNKITTLHHLDLYRLKNYEDLRGIDFPDLIADQHAVTVIEWPEIIENELKKYIKIRFDHLDESTRKISIE